MNEFNGSPPQQTATVLRVQIPFKDHRCYSLTHLLTPTSAVRNRRPCHRPAQVDPHHSTAEYRGRLFGALSR